MATLVEDALKLEFRDQRFRVGLGVRHLRYLYWEEIQDQGMKGSNGGSQGGSGKCLSATKR